MPVTTGYLSEHLKQCRSNDDISVNETQWAADIARITSAAKRMQCRQSQIHIRKCYRITPWQCECISYFWSEFTLTATLSLQPGGMDISLDRTIVLPHCLFNVVASLCLWGLVLAVISILGFQYSIILLSPLNMVLASTETIVYYRLDCRVLAGWYVWRVLTNWDLALLNEKDILSTKHGHGKLFGESLSEQLSDCFWSCCQRASVRAAVFRVAAVTVAAVRAAAVTVAAVRVQVRLVGSQCQRLNYSICRY